MYITDSDKDRLTHAISSIGAYAVTLLAETTGDEASHPDTYAAGYLQGYIHGIDQACHQINHAEDIV